MKLPAHVRDSVVARMFFWLVSNPGMTREEARKLATKQLIAETRQQRRQHKQARSSDLLTSRLLAMIQRKDEAAARRAQPLPHTLDAMPTGEVPRSTTAVIRKAQPAPTTPGLVGIFAGSSPTGKTGK